MNESEIKSLLENIEVTPSARCWDAIEGNLAAAGASGAAAKSVVNKSITKISTTAVKAIVGGSIATVVTAGAIVCGVMLSDKKEQTNDNTRKKLVNSEKISENSENIAKETETLQIETIINGADKPTQIAITEMVKLSEEPNVSVPTQTTGNGEVATDITPAPTPSPNIFHSPAASPISAQQVNTTTSQSTASTKPTSNTSADNAVFSATSTVVPDEEDPVLAGRNDLISRPIVTIEIPNVITPNGDGFNDLFVIKGIEYCESSRLIIRARNGSVVFQATDYQNNWNADNASDGTYYYQFFYTINGIQQTRTGMLTIMR